MIGAESTTAVMARRELAQHGARSVAVVTDGTTTGQSAERPPKAKPVVGAHPKQQQGKGKAKSPGKPKKHTHSMVFQTVLSGQEGEILLDTDADQNSVTSGNSVPLSKAAK